MRALFTDSSTLKGVGKVRQLLARLIQNRHGQISILFGFMSFSIMVGVAGSIDLMRAYQTRQKLSEAAVMACQYASRPSIVSTFNSSGLTAYKSQVNSFITNALGAQKVRLTQTTTQPFIYTGSGGGAVRLSATVNTSFFNIMGITSIPVAANSNCFDTITSINQPPSSSTPTVLSETFATTGCTGSGACGYLYAAAGASTPVGSWGRTLTSATTTSSSTVGYSGGLNWVILGYCLEVDTNVYPNPVPSNSSYHSVELDCDNGSAGAGNSSISTKQYLGGGNYELRYFYNARVKYPDYDPAYICGSAVADLSWATSTNSTYISNSSTTLSSNKLRTDQINVYLDADSNGMPPLHTTNDGTQFLGGSSLIDQCVYTGNFSWVERSVRIYVNSPGYYWLSFAADGASDSYGGAVADIRMCQGTCTGSLQNNFPSTWTTTTKLFEDTFDSPSYSVTSFVNNTSGNMSSSVGTSGSASGWPNSTASGWAAAPFNQIDYVTKTPAQGTQAVEIAGANTTSTPANKRLIARGFLLDPGYYKVSYNYVSDGQISSLTSVFCGATPSAANIPTLAGSVSAVSRPTGGTATISRSSNIVGVFVSHALEASTPMVGGALNSTTSYNNPDGTTSTTPAAAPDAISLTAYDASQSNPLIDICGYAASWQSRTANFLVSKPGYYWLTFSALGTVTEKFAGAIDDVQLWPLGSPYMTTPPSSYVTIPAPGPAIGQLITYSGFEIVANPLTAPAATQ